MNPPAVADLRADLQPLRHRPLLLLVVAFLLGIVWADVFVPPALTVTTLVVLALALVGIALWRLPQAVVKLLPLTAFLFGAMLHAWRLDPGNARWVSVEGLRVERMEGFVHEADPHGQAQSVVLAWKDASGTTVARVFLSLPPEPLVRAGDRLVLEEVELWRPQPSGTPGEWDQARRLAREGIHLEGRAERIGPRLGRQQWRVTIEDRLVDTRAKFLEKLTAAMPGPVPSTYAALLASMVYGMHTTPLPDDIVELFRRSGTIHLLVASGSQVTVIALSLIFLVRGTRRVLSLWGIFVVALGLIGLALLAGLGASINRAVAMAIVLLGTFAWGRKYDFPTALALSGGLLALVNTAVVFHVGAQLTYASAGGVYLAMSRGLSGGPRGSLRSLLTAAAYGSLGAWVFATPLLAYHFHSLVLLGALANLIAVPLAAALLYLGMLAIVGGLFWVPLAVPLCYPARQLLDVMLFSNEFFASLPLAVVENLHFSAPWVLAWYVVAGAAFWLWRSPGLRGRIVGLSWQRLAPAAVLAFGVLLLGLAWARTRPAQLRVNIMDVGAGQCVLIEAPGGRVLVDAGASAQPGRATQILQRRILPFLAVRRVRALDAIVITHAHEDHCNMAAGIMAAIPTRRLLLGSSDGAGADWLAMLQAAGHMRVRMDRLFPGASLYLGPEAWLTVLEPRGPPLVGEYEVNDNSAVLRLAYGKTAVLFPADIMPAGEQRLLRDYPEATGALRANVLVAAHHGGRPSNSPELLRAVAPRHIVVSCGGGTQAPSDETLRRFADTGALIWRTDLQGVITVCSDGAQVSVRAHRPARR